MINDSVDTLNYAIRADNILHGNHHPTLTSKIHLKRRGKQQRNQYRLPWDGVHLAQPAVRDWVVNITKFHHNVHSHLARVAEATCLLSEHQQDDEDVDNVNHVNNENENDTPCVARVAEATCITPKEDLLPAPGPYLTYTQALVQ